MQTNTNVNRTMETETISKNGASSKSLMSRGNSLKIDRFILFFVIIAFSMASCGGNGSKIPDGIYVSDNCYGKKASITFSGNNVITERTYNCTTVDSGEYTYSINANFLILYNKNGKTKDVKYHLEGNRLTLYDMYNQSTMNNGTVFTKSE